MSLTESTQHGFLTLLKLLIALALLLRLATAHSSPLPPITAEAYKLQQWVTPFNSNSNKRIINYSWLKRLNQSSTICAIIPPSSTSYWFAINYGLVKRAKALNSSLQVFHIVDRLNSQQQSNLIQRCLAVSPSSLIISESLTAQVQQILAPLTTKPKVILVGKNISSQSFHASSATSYNDVGQLLAKYMNKANASGSRRNTVLFPGDNSEQYVKSFIIGFEPNLNQNKYQLANIVYTEQSYINIKAKLTNYLNAHLETNTIVGSALVAQAAVEVLEEMSLVGDVEILSYELSAQVYRNIKRGNISASVNSLPVVQGLLAVDLAIQSAKNIAKPAHISPQANIIDSSNLFKFDISYAFAPYGYRETLEVNR